MNFIIKNKFGLILKREKIASFKKKLGLNWTKITNIKSKLNIKH